MWLKRLTNSFLGIRNKEELENDLKKISILKIITLFLTLNITFIGFVFVITRFFINQMNKFIKATSLISNHYKDNIKINLSPPYDYRSRVELGYKNNFFTMYDKNKEIVYLDKIKIARPCIQKLMPNLLKIIN